MIYADMSGFSLSGKQARDRLLTNVKKEVYIYMCCCSLLLQISTLWDCIVD